MLRKWEEHNLVQCGVERGSQTNPPACGQLPSPHICTVMRQGWGRLSTKSSIQGGREEGSQGDAQREQSSIHLHNPPPFILIENTGRNSGQFREPLSKTVRTNSE